HMPAAVGRARTIGALANVLISDLIEESSRRLAANPPASLADLRQRTGVPTARSQTGGGSEGSGSENGRGSGQTVGFSPAIEQGKRELKRFLSTHFYRHPDVLRRVRKAEWIVGDLFRAYRDDPSLLPVEVR